MHNAAIARSVGASDTSPIDMADRRRTAVAKVLASAVLRKAGPDEIADLLGVDDQLVSIDERLRRTELDALVTQQYIADLHEKNRARRDEHDALEQKVDMIKDAARLAFARADQVMDGHTADINMLVEASNENTASIREQGAQQERLETRIRELELFALLQREASIGQGMRLTEHDRHMATLAERRPQHQQPPVRKEDGVPVKIFLWAGAFAAAGAAALSFISG